MPIDRKRWIAWLSLDDEPNDALGDYCGSLAQLLHKQGFSLEVSRFAWPVQSWHRALRYALILFAARPASWMRASSPRIRSGKTLHGMLAVETQAEFRYSLPQGTQGRLQYLGTLVRKRHVDHCK